MWAAKAVFANNCPLGTLVAVDPSAKRLVVRDSIATPARGRGPKKRKKAGRLVVAVADTHPEPELVMSVGSNDVAPVQRKSSAHGSAAPPSGLVTARGRTRVARLASQAERLTDQRRVDRCLEEKSLGTTLLVTATERLAALRVRLRVRSAEATFGRVRNACDALRRVRSAEGTTLRVCTE